MRKLNGRAGFTLIELVIVLIIMAIALGIVTPFMANSFEKYRLRETSRALSEYLRKNRELAISEGIQALVFYVEEDRAFQTRFQKHHEIVSLNVPSFLELIEGVHVEIEVNDPIEILRGEDSHFVFYPMGNAVGGTVKLFFKEERAAVIEIDDLTGSITILKDDRSL